MKVKRIVTYSIELSEKDADIVVSKDDGTTNEFLDRLRSKIKATRELSNEEEY